MKPPERRSDPRRKVFVVGAAAVMLASLIRPGDGPGLTVVGTAVWAAVLLATGLVPGPNGRLNRPLASLAAIASVVALALPAATPLGMDPATSIWVMVLPLLYLVVSPSDPVVSAMSVLASTAAMWWLSATTPSHDVTETARWVVQTALAGSVAVMASFWFRRERDQDLAREREQSRVAQELAVSERLRARAEELASTGRIAAEVSHEINNPLTYVATNLEYLREILPTDGRSPELEEALDHATEGADRIRQIVADLLSMVRLTDDVRSAFVDDTVLEAIRMARNEVRHHARLETRLESHAVVAGDPRRLAQLLLNLLTNAAQAIPAGQAAKHQIVVSTELEGEPWDADDRPRREPQEDGHGMVMIRVRDTGSGITPEVQARLFEPFFTTKEPGKGTGLGLAVCKRIVEELGGSIDFTTEIGVGTEFQVRLPATEAPAPAPDLTPLPIDLGSARVLVVDDDELVGSSIVRVLRREHEVVYAQSGHAALELLQHDSRFDLVVCDLMMPDMSGMELHTRVVDRDPELARRFVFMTGGAFTDAAARFVENAEHPVLTKPVRAAELRHAVAEAVTRVRAGRVVKLTAVG